MSLPTPLNVVIEQAIEALLTIDPDTRERLSVIEDKLVRVRVSSPAITVTLSVTNGCVYVVGDDDVAADTTISGSLAALRSLSRGNESLYRGEVTVDGDVATGQQLKEIIAGLDPDWEELISPLLGDSLTHRFGQAGRQFGGWVARTRSALQRNTSDYLQEEVSLVAPDCAVHAFCQEVDLLRADADRLEARVRLMERQLAVSDDTTGSPVPDPGSTGDDY
ncbi:MAG: hypothetical protein HKN42_16705 [Granulosicoccus sp.]|nr:hypothetical protein [Granulosicoccus sp.]